MKFGGIEPSPVAALAEFAHRHEGMGCGRALAEGGPEVPGSTASVDAMFRGDDNFPVQDHCFVNENETG